MSQEAKANKPTCQVCHRPLSDPASIERGVGPICAAREGLRWENKMPPQQMPMLPFNGDIVCRRIDGKAVFNIEQKIVMHSPTGMEWGYEGSGPADLALNIVALFIGGERAKVGGLYQEFKRDFVAKLPDEGGTIKREDIIRWLMKKGAYLKRKEDR